MTSKRIVRDQKGQFGWQRAKDEDNIKFQINVDDNNMHKYLPTKSLLSYSCFYVTVIGLIMVFLVWLLVWFYK